MTLREWIAWRRSIGYRCALYTLGRSLSFQLGWPQDERHYRRAAENLRRWLLPEGHRDHRKPERDMRIALAAITSNHVTSNDWDGVRAPAVSGRGAEHAAAGAPRGGHAARGASRRKRSAA